MSTHFRDGNGHKRTDSQSIYRQHIMYLFTFLMAEICIRAFLSSNYEYWLIKTIIALCDLLSKWGKFVIKRIDYCGKWINEKVNSRYFSLLSADLLTIHKIKRYKMMSVTLIFFMNSQKVYCSNLQCVVE